LGGDDGVGEIEPAPGPRQELIGDASYRRDIGHVGNELFDALLDDESPLSPEHDDFLNPIIR